MQVYTNPEFLSFVGVDTETHCLFYADPFEFLQAKNKKEVFILVEQPEKDFLDDLVNNFDLLTYRDTPKEKAVKWGMLSEHYAVLGLSPLYGFEFDGFNITMPYNSENTIDEVTEPESYYGQPYIDWLSRFEHGVNDFDYPMPRGFEDSTKIGDELSSITNSELGVQVFIHPENRNKRPFESYVRFEVKTEPGKDKSGSTIEKLENFTQLLNYLDKIAFIQ